VRHGSIALLPFEGAGAVSEWRLELPAAVKQFDHNTIVDVQIAIKLAFSLMPDSPSRHRLAFVGTHPQGICRLLSKIY